MKFPRIFSKTHTDLANDEINATHEQVARLQALADHHANLARTYQQGVDSIRGLKEAPLEATSETAPPQPAPTYGPTPLMRRTRSA